LQKTQAYPKVRRGFLQAGTDANSKVYTFDGVGNRIGQRRRSRAQEIGADRRRESLISGFGVGNDVVDLDDPETVVEGLNPRFDERVFTSEESRKLAESCDTHALRWTLWAAKESAYKLAQRWDPETVFSQSRFVTDIGDNGRGIVHYGDWHCVVSISHEGSAIHALATSNHSDRERVVSGLGRIEESDDPSVRVRELAINSVARHLQIELTALIITAGEDRIPVLLLDGQPSGYLSLSHHGALTAFAWMPPRGERGGEGERGRGGRMKAQLSKR